MKINSIGLCALIGFSVAKGGAFSTTQTSYSVTYDKGGSIRTEGFNSQKERNTNFQQNILDRIKDSKSITLFKLDKNGKKTIEAILEIKK